MIGRTVGHYRILDKLGAGGMGEVYRAEDLTLKRHVALKILPPEVAGSQEKLERFQREAETLASLDHPNIVTLYSVEKAELGPDPKETLEPGHQPQLGHDPKGMGHDPELLRSSGHVPVRDRVPFPPTIPFLTMQLVEGSPLSEVISEQGMPTERVIEIAIPLSEGLRAAHERGITHRDLKPANVMIDHEGRVKILDFGLAKLRRPEFEPGANQLLTEAMTQEGVVMGTVPYMSPEQIQGETVDHRSDIFSLGVILYEMFCGRRPFDAANSAVLISSILRDTPIPVSEVQSGLPEQLDRVLQRCLEKDPRLRFQSAEQVGLELENVGKIMDSTPSAEIEAAVERALAKVPSGQIATARQEGLSTSGPEKPVEKRVGVPRWLMGLFMAAGMAAAGYYLLFDRLEDSSPPTSLPAQLNYKQLTSQPGAEQFPSLSPDGQWIAYSGESSGNQDVYLQSVSGQTPINLTPDSAVNDIQPAFSPNGELIAFRSDREGGGLFVMGRTGEAVRRVTRAGFNPAWSPDGTRLVYTTESVELSPLNWAGRSSLWSVDATSGDSIQISEGDAVQASWSPGGERIAYVGRLADPTRMDIWSMPAGGGDPVAVTRDSHTDWSPRWSPDGRLIYFASDRGGSMNLWRMAVDEQSGSPLGEPEPLTTPATYLAHLSLSEDARRIVYNSVLMTQNVQRIAFDPEAGVVQSDSAWITSGSILWSSPDPSADGEWAAFYSRARPEGDLYVVRRDGTGLRQVTSDAAIDRVPRWSPDGQWIAFFSDRSGSLQLWRIRPDGSDLQQLTYLDDASLAVWSPDGQRIAVLGSLTADPTTYIFDPSRAWSEQEPDALPPVEKVGVRFIPTSWSLDGMMLAGQDDFPSKGIVVFSFETETYRPLTNFGEWPIWLPDSQRLMFVAGGKDLYVMHHQATEPEKVFSGDRDVIGPPRLTRDGHEIYLTRRVTEADIWLLTLGPQE